MEITKRDKITKDHADFSNQKLTKPLNI